MNWQITAQIGIFCATKEAKFEESAYFKRIRTGEATTKDISRVAKQVQKIPAGNVTQQLWELSYISMDQERERRSFRCTRES